MLLAAASLVLVAALAVGGTLAYLTDTETKENAFALGKVDIEVEEPDWNPDPDTPVKPGDTLTKNPLINNTGTEDAYVFFKVAIPYVENGTVLNADGSKDKVEDFADYFTLNDMSANWTKVGDVTQENGKNVYIYAYGAEDALTALTAAQGQTDVLFESVTMRNILELNSVTEVNNSIDVTGYAIQVSNIVEAGQNADPETVWNYIVNQEAAAESEQP